MKSSGKIRISISFEQENAETVSNELTIDILDSEIKDIDACEQYLLEGTYEVMRAAMSKHITALSKKKGIQKSVLLK